jgi:hypothetical protein
MPPNFFIFLFFWRFRWRLVVLVRFCFHLKASRHTLSRAPHVVRARVLPLLSQSTTRSLEAEARRVGGSSTCPSPRHARAPPLLGPSERKRVFLPLSPSWLLLTRPTPVPQSTTRVAYYALAVYSATSMGNCFCKPPPRVRPRFRALALASRDAFFKKVGRGFFFFRYHVNGYVRYHVSENFFRYHTVLISSFFHLF